MCYKLKSEQCCTKLKDEINNHTSGKRLHNYGKSPVLMGKSTINGHF